jgi:hypothetical protein
MQTYAHEYCWCPRKAKISTQEMQNLKEKGVKCANVQIYIVCYLSTKVNVSRDIRYSTSTGMFGE